MIYGMTLYDLYGLPFNKIIVFGQHQLYNWNTGGHLRVYPHFRVIQSVEAVTTSEETSGAAAQKVAEAVMKASEPLGPWHDLTASPVSVVAFGFREIRFPQASSGEIYMGWWSIFDLESLPMGKVWEHVVVVVLFEKRT